MLTFDLVEVRGFVADLDARMMRCQNGEGMECVTLDSALLYHAGLCREFSNMVRQWGRKVFAGHVAFDPEVEMAWLREGHRLYNRAMEMHALGQTAEVPCFILEGKNLLLPALWDLYRLLKEWVTPKLAVGPSSRQGLALDIPAAEEVRQKVASLAPLPADWQPDDPRQRAMYRMLRTS